MTKFFFNDEIFLDLALNFDLFKICFEVCSKQDWTKDFFDEYYGIENLEKENFRMAPHPAANMIETLSNWSSRVQGEVDGGGIPEMASEIDNHPILKNKMQVVKFNYRTGVVFSLSLIYYIFKVRKEKDNQYQLNLVKSQ